MIAAACNRSSPSTADAEGIDLVLPWLSCLRGSRTTRRTSSPLEPLTGPPGVCCVLQAVV
jgi:hypothetical protein